MNFKRVNNDVNGNPRYVFHFSDFLTGEEANNLKGFDFVFKGYELAVSKAKKIGGSKYRGKDFGGGIVFQSYNIQDTINKIQSII